MTREIDCRGLTCPAPVLQTKNAIEKERFNIIKVTVDNEAAKQNVTRFLESQNLRSPYRKKEVISRSLAGWGEALFLKYMCLKNRKPKRRRLWLW